MGIHSWGSGAGRPFPAGGRDHLNLGTPGDTWRHETRSAMGPVGSAQRPGATAVLTGNSGRRDFPSLTSCVTPGGNDPRETSEPPTLFQLKEHVSHILQLRQVQIPRLVPCEGRPARTPSPRRAPFRKEVGRWTACRLIRSHTGRTVPGPTGRNPKPVSASLRGRHVMSWDNVPNHKLLRVTSKSTYLS